MRAQDEMNKADQEARRPLCGQNRLHCAALFDLPALAQFSIENGGDPNAADDYGRTPLHFAAARRAHATARVLLTAGADPRVRSVDGMTPGDVAIDDKMRQLIAAHNTVRACASPY